MISVVIPCHNYGRYLPEAVASVDAQTRRADEIVIVDDGSSDDTGRTIEDLRACRPDLIAVSRSPARGAATTFNDAVRASHGDLVVILSADDRLSPQYLERLAGVLDADPALDFAYCEARLFGSVERTETAPPFDSRELARGNFINGSAMFRRKLFDRVGGFRTDFGAMEDWEFWLHAVALGYRGRAVDGCWLEYRRHTNGSRNSITSATALRTRLRLWRLHPGAVRSEDVAIAVLRGLARRAGAGRNFVRA